MCKQLHLKQKLCPIVTLKNLNWKGIFTLVGRKIANTQFIRWSGRQVYGIWSVNAAETSNFQKKNLTDLLTVDECLAKKNLLQAILKTIPISGTPFIGFKLKLTVWKQTCKVINSLAS